MLILMLMLMLTLTLKLELLQPVGTTSDAAEIWQKKLWNVRRRVRRSWESDDRGGGTDTRCLDPVGKHACQPNASVAVLVQHGAQPSSGGCYSGRRQSGDVGRCKTSRREPLLGISKFALGGLTRQLLER